jgi:hypothetical protein
MKTLKDLNVDIGKGIIQEWFRFLDECQLWHLEITSCCHYLHVSLNMWYPKTGSSFDKNKFSVLLPAAPMDVLHLIY